MTRPADAKAECEQCANFALGVCPWCLARRGLREAAEDHKLLRQQQRIADAVAYCTVCDGPCRGSGAA